MTRLTRLPALLALAACGGAAANTAETAHQPRQLIVAVDLSGSQTPRMLADEKAFLVQLVDGLSWGDQLVLLEMHQARAHEDARRWADTFPRPADPTFVSSRDRDRLAGARAGARSVADALFDPATAGKAMHTDIISTLHVAAEYARDAGGRRPTLVLLSDMLQSANGIEMEGLRRMPDERWIERQKAMGLLPRLDGVCVAVIGADPTTPAGVRVRDFWLRYFAAAGARLDVGGYRVMAPDGAVADCG